MHGKKKWIRNYEGRLIRSRDRTKKDYLSDLNRPYKVLREEEKNCPDCKARIEEHGVEVPITRYDGTETIWIRSPMDNECEYHRWKDDVHSENWYHYGYWNEGRGWVSKQLAREYRAIWKQKMREARTFEGYDAYDDIPPHRAADIWRYT